ncbi:MAG: ABC transporter ATP-binding protein [Desulfurococcales archaeon]|nr:ABC transporter ATP-binding protein [Desulfurococcales archaeon]
MLEVVGLHKRYKGAVAVDGLSLRLDRGEVLGLLGPNGAGKTTTIKSIVGLVRPDRGRILLDGRDLMGDAVRLKRYIGYSPELPEAPPWATVCSLLEALAALDGVPKASVRSVVRSALEELGVEDLCMRRLGSLSKGQRKRVLIAQALMGEKSYILMDEPFSGLDPEWVAGVRRLILRLRGEGVGVLVSSHILKELEEVVDRVAIISRGRSLFEGTLEELASKLAGEELLVIRTPRPAEAAKILEQAGIERVEVLAQAVRATVPRGVSVQELVSRVMAEGIEVRGFESKRVDLEEAYLKLVGAGGGR